MIKPILNIRYSLECDNDVFDFYLLFLKEMEEGKCTLFYLYLCVCVCCVVIHPYIFFHSAVSGLGSNHFTQNHALMPFHTQQRAIRAYTSSILHHDQSLQLQLLLVA